MQGNERWSHERGASLVSVLILLALLSGITVVFLYANRDHVQTASNDVELAKSRSIATSAIDWTLFELASPEARTGRQRGLVKSCTIDGWFVFIELEDEAGKIDLNADPGDQLLSLLLTSYSEPEALSARDRILDFRDGDSDPRPYGAEADDYDLEALPFGIKNGLFSSINDLDQVAGLPPEMVQSLLADVTVHNRGGRMQLNQASARVQQALSETGNANQTIPAAITGRVFTVKAHVLKPSSSRISLRVIAEFMTENAHPIIHELDRKSVV